MYYNYAGATGMNLGCPGESGGTVTLLLPNQDVDWGDFPAQSCSADSDIMASSNRADRSRTGLLLGPSNNDKHKENSLAKILKQNMKSKRIRF